ncbi:TMAO reductase system periplasmic protein TorT [Vibrio sp. JC009]|uniref:TMAO reductase system periplasmic protein TorT n=1 Tax=Vibrio sp. JC009 TaxID=2912314 RepID=UPI0023B09038|nr:TMAO reductase system periplasmic protein TorT [Vibrio sp. JC009]WED24502.1 TMAO reductase system periplasmic protein TorT [Vibrio sp. JC009]
MRWALFRFITLFVFLVNSVNIALADQIEVSSFYGNYDTSMKKIGQQSLSLRGPRIETWNTSVQTQKPYTIGVLLPNLQDSYWVAVNYGIMRQAEESNIAVKVVDARGYKNLETQQKQLRDFLRSDIDGLILGSISYTKNNRLIKEITNSGIPVVALVNDVEAENISAKSMVSYYDMGFFTGEYVAEQETTSDKELNVIFLPGPKGSGWADEALAGFQAATEFTSKKINITEILWGDTDTDSQSALLKKALKSHPSTDYIIGNAVAAEAALELVKQSGSSAKIAATYITPAIFEAIRAGKIVAAPSDMASAQARIALGMLCNLLEGQKAGADFPFRAGPLIPVITTGNINKYTFEDLFGPVGYKPVFQWPPLPSEK